MKNSRSLYNHLPNGGFVRLPAVLAHIPVSKSTWWAGVKAGRFPRPVKLAPRISAWRTEDIKLLIENPQQWQRGNNTQRRSAAVKQNQIEDFHD